MEAPAPGQTGSGRGSQAADNGSWTSAAVPAQPRARNLRLIVTDPELVEAHADFRAAREAERLGLISPKTRARLCSRASRRIARLAPGR